MSSKMFYSKSAREGDKWAISLRASAFGIGVWSLAYSLASILMSVTSNPESIWSKLNSDAELSEDDVALIHRLLIVYSWLMIFAVSSSSLIFGAVRRRRNFLMPWLVVKMAVIAFELVQLVYNCLHLNMQRLIIVPFQISFSVIFWSVVYRFYVQLRSERISALAFVDLVEDDESQDQ